MNRIKNLKKLKEKQKILNFQGKEQNTKRNKINKRANESFIMYSSTLI